MARTIYFLDGSREVLLHDEIDTEQSIAALEQILRERLGDDTAVLFRSIIEDLLFQIDKETEYYGSYD